MWIIKSPEYIVRKLQAERLRRIFWQGENPIGGPRTDVCPIVAEYYEVETINNLKGTDVCYSSAAKKLNTILADYMELSKVEVTTLIRSLYRSNPQNRTSYRDKSRCI